MQELKVIGVENGALLVASDEGARFASKSTTRSNRGCGNRSPIAGPADGSPRATSRCTSGQGCRRKTWPRSPGASIDYIRKFEGPVLAEREYVIESALAVPVTMAVETDPLGDGASFGSVIRRRLAESGAFSERWASWKEPGARLDRQAHLHRRRDRARRPVELRPEASDTLTPQRRSDLALAAGRAARRTCSPACAPFRSTSKTDASTLRQRSGRSTAAPSESTTGTTRARARARRLRPPRRAGTVRSADRRVETRASPARRTTPPTCSKPCVAAAGSASPWISRTKATWPPTRRRAPCGSSTSRSTRSPNSRSRPAVTDRRPRHSADADRQGTQGRAAMPSWDEIVFGARSTTIPESGGAARSSGAYPADGPPGSERYRRRTLRTGEAASRSRRR